MAGSPSSAYALCLALVATCLVGCTTRTALIVDTPAPPATAAPSLPTSLEQVLVPTPISLASVQDNPAAYHDQLVVIDGIIDPLLTLPMCEVYFGAFSRRTLYTRAAGSSTRTASMVARGVAPPLIPAGGGSDPELVRRVVGIVRWYDGPDDCVTPGSDSNSWIMPPNRQYWYIDVVGTLPVQPTP